MNDCAPATRDLLVAILCSCLQFRVGSFCFVFCLVDWLATIPFEYVSLFSASSMNNLTFFVRYANGREIFFPSFHSLALHFCATTLNCTCFGNNANLMALEKKTGAPFRIHSILRKNGFRLDEIVEFARHHTQRAIYLNKPILQLDAMRLDSLFIGGSRFGCESIYARS